MQFLVDMCMDVRVADWLRDHGYDAIHLREEGLQRMPNGEIFDKGIKENRIIIVNNL